MNKVYFPNLNGLRFIAASLVVIHHIEQYKKILNLPNYFENPTISLLGKIGVILFFVLSGFLITYLLLKERERTTTVSVVDFYKRRVLRIWPLYFLIIIISFFLLPKSPFFNLGNLSNELQDNIEIKILLFVFFLPNVALGFFPPVPYASQLWSIGYEEQFYFFWPWFVKIKNKVINILIVFLSTYIVSKIIVFTILKDFLIQNNLFTKIKLLYDFPGYESIVIGGILAWFAAKKATTLNFLFKKRIQMLIYLILAFLLFFGVKLPVFNNILYACLFAIIIANLALNKESIINLENKLFNYIGKVSYGFYMYHSIAIVIVLKTLIYFNIGNLFLEYFLSFFITLFFSIISFEFYESYFIKKKKMFSR
jgi:peptidoglycan/LPS O-acetylase OafA/YrhL